jgi:hypothetical protein
MDIHEESLEDCPNWWWKTKITSGKVGGPTYKINKIGNLILIDKGPIWWKYFYFR